MGRHKEVLAQARANAQDKGYNKKLEARKIQGVIMSVNHLTRDYRRGVDDSIGITWNLFDRSKIYSNPRIEAETESPTFAYRVGIVTGFLSIPATYAGILAAATLIQQL